MPGGDLYNYYGMQLKTERLIRKLTVKQAVELIKINGLNITTRTWQRWEQRISNKQTLESIHIALRIDGEKFYKLAYFKMELDKIIPKDIKINEYSRNAALTVVLSDCGIFGVKASAIIESIFGKCDQLQLTLLMALRLLDITSLTASDISKIKVVSRRFKELDLK